MGVEPPGFYGDKLDLSTVEFTSELLRSIPAPIALRHRVLPIAVPRTGALVIALADPSDVDAIDSLTHLLHMEIVAKQADPFQLGVFLQRLYGTGSQLQG
jgi:hypothetical protein